jgi:hypothetical protein
MSRVLIYGALTVLALYYLYLALGKFYGELD